MAGAAICFHPAGHFGEGRVRDCDPPGRGCLPDDRRRPTEYTLRTDRPVHGTAVVTTAAKTLHGSLHSVAPASYNDDECAANVGYDHVAIWLVRAGSVQLPVYVDAGREGTTLLTWCATRRRSSP
jgi:hypothetical protein